MARLIERENEQRLLEEFVDGESVPKLAQAYGTTEQIVRGALQRTSERMFSPTDQHRPDVSIANEAELIDRFVGGESISDLALAYHTREAQVHGALNRASERMQRSVELLDETSTDEDIERANARSHYMNRYTEQLDAETARLDARTDYMHRYADRLKEEADRLDDQSERSGEVIAFIVVAAVIGLGIFALTSI